MSVWPWPLADVKWFVRRAIRALGEQRHAEALAYRFLRQLAAGRLNAQPECPVRACRNGELVVRLPTWAKGHSAEGLAEHIWTADDRQFGRALDAHRWAVRLAGRPRRRGDIVRLRTHRRWWDIRWK